MFKAFSATLTATLTTVATAALLAAGSGLVSAADAMHPFLAANTADLVDASGQKANAKKLLGNKLVFIYFSAHWCPPCRAFTPELVKFYNDNGGGTKFSLLFVSDDKDADAMAEYMKSTSMPWAAVKFDTEAGETIKKKYQGQGIPDLVLVNEKDEVVSDSFNGDEYLGPHHVLDDYSAQAK